jgi:hypothetical protein
VIGQEVPLAVRAAVACAGAEDLEAALERAEAAHLARAWPGGDGLRFAVLLGRAVM